MPPIRMYFSRRCIGQVRILAKGVLAVRTRPSIVRPGSGRVLPLLHRRQPIAAATWSRIQPLKDLPALEAEIGGLRSHLRKFLGAEIVTPAAQDGDVRGFHQVYGGLRKDFWAEPALFVALERGERRRLVLEVAGPGARVGPAPLRLTPTVDGVALAPQDLAPSTAHARLEWELPAASVHGLSDVLITADRGFADRKGARQRRLAYRLHRIAFE